MNKNNLNNYLIAVMFSAIVDYSSFISKKIQKDRNK